MEVKGYLTWTDRNWKIAYKRIGYILYDMNIFFKKNVKHIQVLHLTGHRTVFYSPDWMANTDSAPIDVDLWRIEVEELDVG